MSVGSIDDRLWGVILAGGIGSRFWPVSTPARPKQLLPLATERPLIHDTIERILPLATVVTPNLAEARSLAGEVLTNSRGVTIDTFHGWFASLCQMAPLASGFSRQSEPSDQTLFWMDTAIDAFTAQLLDGSDTPELQAFDTLAAHMDRMVLRQVFHKALTNRVACSLWLGNSEAPALETVFGIDATQKWPVEVLRNSHFIAQWQQAARWLAMGTPKQQGNAVEISKV